MPENQSNQTVSQYTKYNPYIYGLEFTCNVCALFVKENLIIKLENHLKAPHVTFRRKMNA